MRGSQRLHTLTSLVIFISSLGILISWYTGQIFPWIHLSTFLSLLIVLATQPFNLGSKSHLNWTVFTLCIVGVLYRAPLVLLPDTLPGKDPEKYALFARLTVLTGDYTIPDLSFYGTAGGFHTYIAETAMIADITPEQAMVIIGVGIGIWAPLMAASFPYLIFDKATHRYEAAAVAALIAVVLALSARLSLIPFAQSVGTVLFVSFLYLVLKQMGVSWGTPLKMSYVLAMTAVLIAMMLSHKIPVLIASGVVGGIWVVTKISSSESLWPWTPTDQPLSFAFVAMTAVMAGIQQNITGYLADGIRRAQNTFIEGGGIPARTGIDPPAAISPDIGMLSVFESHSHAPILLFVSMFAWLAIGWYLVVSDRRPKSVTVALLVVIASLTTLTVGGLAGALLPDGIHPLRFHALVEVPLAGLIGIGFVLFHKRFPTATYSPSRSSVRRVFFSVLVVIIVFHTFTSVVAPDYPGQERGYLTESEMSGKEFGVEHVSGEIYTDYIYAVRTPHRERITDKTNDWAQLGGTPAGIRFVPSNLELLNGTHVSEGHPTLIYRPNADIYSTSGVYRDFRYRLQWDVEDAGDSQYHRVYDSGGAIVYRNPAL